jgi:lactate permease
MGVAGGPWWRHRRVVPAVTPLDSRESCSRKVFGWSVALLLLICIVVVLQSTSVLGWMVP